MDQELDVKLFITCRLCLEEPGSYQIVPCIKGQISFCFGIDVDPFDGLPQLICKKCKGVLAEYYTIKNVFVEKQQRLHKKLAKDIKDTEKSEPLREDDLPKECPSPADVTTAEHPAPADEPAPDVAAAITRKGSRKKSRSTWKKAFNKHYMCTICNKGFLSEKSIKIHSRIHKRFINKHSRVFKNYLTVRLNKIDTKKNSTGSLRNLVYNKDKIIERGSSQYHFSFYLKKCRTLNNDIDENENLAAKRLRVSSESSNDGIIKGKKRKTGRIVSTSSTQTVILEDNNDTAESNTKETEIINNECINLDDTSSDCPKNTDLKKPRILPQRRQVKAEVADYKNIQNIVTMCHKNYFKKVQANTDVLNKSTFSESSLKHKVLSLGRKVLTKQGFVCTGLLRYMEHKDLEIIWTPTSNEMQKKGSNFVRIMTKLKSREDSENDDACWKTLHDISFYRNAGTEEAVAPSHDVRSNDQAPPSPVRSEGDPTLAGAPCEPNDLNCGNKLLNKTPVANPRQLPKKNISEAKLVVAADDAAVVPANLIDGLEDAHLDDENMCLPIITSTTSLSLNVSEKEKQEVAVIEKPPPRIKVKPASELMTARALNNQESVEDIWAFNPIQSSLPHHLSNNISVDALVSSNNDEQSRRLDYILLDSPLFPNTKTLAPFQYFKKVLLLHRLRLLDLNADLPNHFNCLIKFKLRLKQDAKRPIAVLLSLYCSKDTFCFSFKDTNSKKFDPNQLPAFWQWELLKIYKSDVVDKILQNAIKVGKEVHEHTKLFLCLLKSINVIKEA